VPGHQIARKANKKQVLVPNPTEMLGKDGILQWYKLLWKDFRMGGKNTEGVKYVRVKRVDGSG
jgi:hypothetical protein